MGKHRKQFTKLQLSERKRIEAELAAIPPLAPSAMRLTSTSGFIDYYLQMQDLYDTQVEAYDRLEDFHIAVMGKRRYSEFDSFRKVLSLAKEE